MHVASVVVVVVFDYFVVISLNFEFFKFYFKNIRLTSVIKNCNRVRGFSLKVKYFGALLL